MKIVSQRDAALKSRESFHGVLLSWRMWWRHAVVASVDQAEVIEERREEAQLSARYLFMLAMSAGIAVLGLLLSSPAVVIGAMLLSPLMGPIIGLGFALATGDFAWMRKAARALGVGTLLSIGLCALIVVLSPLQTVTPEIAARTRPNLFDLAVALFSALAGAYAMIRGREGTVVGVAIATALMPPLAVVGFGLATFNWTVFSGALLLFVTNLVTIALTAMVMARLYGFHTSLSHNQTRLQDLLVFGAFFALAIPLGLSLRQIVWESNAARLVNSAILESFPNKALMSQIDIDFDAEPIKVTATVLTPDIEIAAENVVARRLTRLMEAPVALTLDQFQVGTSASAAQAAQLAAARRQEQEATDREVRDLTARLALIAGVPEEEVLIDRDRRRARVAAQRLEGAELATYRELERRIAGRVPGWSIEIEPPARPLPPIPMGEEGPSAEGEAAIALIGWAAQRIRAPVLLSGTQENLDRVRALFGESGPRLILRPQAGPGDVVRTAWASPDADEGD